MPDELEIAMIEYEWDVEEVVAHDTEQHEAGEILDHSHQNSYVDCVRWASDEPPSGSKWDIVLVRDVIDKYTSLEARYWAYLEDGKLPEFFEDAFGNLTGYRVPTRFHNEVLKTK